MNGKELVCAIFSHDYGESGKTTCQKHKFDFNAYKICNRCGLQRNIGPRQCDHCYDDFTAKCDALSDMPH